MKKLSYLLIGLLLLLNNQTTGQITFQKSYGGLLGDYGGEVLQTSDSCYIICGYTKSFGSGNFDMYLIKTDANGDTLWTRAFGKAIDDRIKSVTQTNDGGYAITGFLDYDTYLMKTNATGILQWSQNYGFSSGNGGNSIQQTYDGGFVFTGFLNAGTQNDIYIIKADSAGNTQWIKSYGGTTFSDVSACVKQTNDTGYIIAGSYSSGSSNYDMLLIKTDSLGDTLWTRCYGGPNNDIGYSVLSTADGGYFFLGSTSSFSNAGVYLIKTDSIGIPLWSKTYNGNVQNMPTSQIYSIKKTNDDCYIIFAEWASFNDLYLLKIDSLGSVLWAKTYGDVNNEYMGSGQQTFDGGYIIAGTTISFGTGNYDVYLIKTDSIGNSGCNEINKVITPVTPATHLYNNAIVVSTPVIVNALPDYNITGGSTVTTACSTVGIPNQLNNKNYETTIVPNPSNGNFGITFDKTIIKGSIEILNILGKNIFALDIFNESKKEINLESVSSGIYFVKVVDEDKYYCKKIIIVRD